MVMFWQMNIGKKAAHKMSAKLGPGVDFVIFWRKNISKKAAHKMSAKLGPGLF